MIFSIRQARQVGLWLLAASCVPAVAFAQPFVHAARGSCFPRFGCSPAQSLLNAATGHELKSNFLPGPQRNSLPAGIVVSPDGARTYMTLRQVFFASAGGDSLVVMDTATYSIVATINLASGSGRPLLSPDGSRLFIPQRSGTVAVIDTSALTVTTTVTVGG